MNPTRRDAKEWVATILAALPPGDVNARLALSLLDLDNARYHALLALNAAVGLPAPEAVPPLRLVTEANRTITTTTNPESK